MATIEVKVEIKSTVDKVWDIISDIDMNQSFGKEQKKSKTYQKKETQSTVK